MQDSQVKWPGALAIRVSSRATKYLRRLLRLDKILDGSALLRRICWSVMYSRNRAQHCGQYARLAKPIPHFFFKLQQPGPLVALAEKCTNLGGPLEQRCTRVSWKSLVRGDEVVV